ncbi:MAG: aconitase family protein, partial [Oscillospiraceae bacterium]
SSLFDMLKVAWILKGKTVSEEVSLVIAPGSRQVLDMLSDCGALTDILNSGARVLECACGPCIGMGQSPQSKGVSLRTFNRNFEGRSGTKDALLYLVSPETAAVSALTGVLTDPTEMCKNLDIKLPDSFTINDNMIVMPATEQEAADVKISRGPNIKPFPVSKILNDEIHAPIVLKVGDNITTDHIMPAGSAILPYRSNIPYLSKFCFTRCDDNFPGRAKAAGEGIIIGGDNYGQGSSREHAALVPLYLGIRAIIATGFARIHKDNLVNAGIVPLVFASRFDYEALSLNDRLETLDLVKAVKSGSDIVNLRDAKSGNKFIVKLELTERQRSILLAGGLLNYTKQQIK